MPLSDKDLGAILLQENYISQEELTRTLAIADDTTTPLKRVLIDQGLLTQDLYENAIAEHYKIPFYDLVTNPPDPETVTQLPEEVARTYGVIVVKVEGAKATVAVSDPSIQDLQNIIEMNIGKEEAIIPEPKEEEKKEGEEKADSKKDKQKGGLLNKEINFSFGKKKEKKEEGKQVFSGSVTLVYAPRSAIEAGFVYYKKPLATRFQAIIDEQGKVAPEILEEIVRDAIELRASDIHFEPQEKNVTVRFRVDGVMHVAGRIPREYYEGVVNRVKIEGNMRIDEHFGAQDGAIRYETGKGKMDVRVSIVPLVDGEKIVMRLLSEYVRTLTLSDLGFSESNKSILTDAAHKPFGMILTTGPTGSGKSTTLYGLMKLRNAPDVNISTIEDPVEYKIPGINHIQTNPKADLTFAKGLRALVRQDPDIILVGEIRDGETADVAVNAALTGHLLFSTLHSNDAATSVPRLLEMGVEPFLLASTLEVVIGQRLVRRICPQCRYSYSVEPEEAVKLFRGAEEYFSKDTATTLYKGKGCEACGNTGYSGRIGIHELLVITPEMEELITARASSTDINDLARKQGMKLMFEDGLEKAKSGVTTVEELSRVTAPPAVLMDTLQPSAMEEAKEQRKMEKPKKETSKKTESSSSPDDSEEEK